MQKALLLLLFLVTFVTLHGQKLVVQGEYFWDTDPGAGNGIALVATDGNFDTALENVLKNGIDVSSLSTGAHSFQVRIKGQDGTWSSVFKQTIFVQANQSILTRSVNVVQGEYFWDVDPGQGSGVPVLALDGNFNTCIENVLANGISAAPLAIGAHSFQVRVKGFDGSWGSVFKQTIYVESTATAVTRNVKVNQAEYFWDTDPGAGNGTLVLAFDGNFNTTIEDLLKNGILVSSLSIGPHSFCVRVQGNDGSWSSVFKQTIYIESTPTLVTRTINVTQAEYFWDTDPGSGNGTVVLALDGNFSSTIEDLIKNGILVSSLSVGPHSFNVRVKGNDGSWSSVFKQTIAVEATPVAITRTVKVLQGEFYWDTDPGVGNGTTVLALDGNFDNAIENVLKNGVDVSALSLGAHSFNVRVKGNNGSWSTVFKQTIFLEGPLVSVSRTVRLTQGEYFWDTDPGAGNGTSILAVDGNFDFAIENVVRNSIDVSALSLGAHSFQVRVKGQNGSWSAVFKQTVFIECSSPTAPSISISSTQNGQCQGSQNVFNATAVNGGTNPTYTWKVNGIVVGTNSSTLTINTLNNGDLVTCELISNSTCASPNTAISNAIPVTLSPVVTPTITIASSPGSSICTGTSVLFTATATNAGTPLYQWKVNGVNVGTNSSQFTSSTLNNGDVVTCTMTGSLTCSTPLTVTSNAIAMTVNTIATPFITVSANNTTICQGTTVSFTASAANGGATPTYQWKVNGINVGTNTSVYSSSSLQNGDVVTCVLTSSLACTTAATATSNSISMSVSSSVAASVSIASSNGTTICQGTAITFTATPTNGGTIPNYQWQVNGLNVGFNQATYSTASLTNGDVVSCLMTSTASCPSPLTSASNSISMTVNSGTAPSVIVTSAQGTTICAGTSVLFTATPSNGGSSPSYQWKINGINVGTNVATFNTTSLVQGDVVTCVLTSNALCVSGQSTTSNALSFTVTSNVTPLVAITSSATTICPGATVTFTATPTNGGTSSYQWKVNGVNTGLNSPNFSTTSLQNGDVVSCVLTSSLTCVTTSTATSNTISITVLPSVSTAINISSGSGSTICQGATATFTATPTNGGTTPVYQWQINGQNTGTNASTFTSTSLQNGDVITCNLTSNAACPNPSTSTSNAIVLTVNSVSAPTVTITSAQGTSICSGTSVFFTATPTNGGTSPNYQWKINGTNVGPNSAFFNTNALVQGDIVTCILTSNATCTNGQTATSNALIFTVTANVTPAISITANATTACQGTLVSFTSTTSNAGSSPVYQWKVNGINVGTNSATFSSTTLQNGDVVTCVLNSSLPCVSSTSVTSNAIPITITPFSAASVSITATNGNTICQGSSASFVAVPVNGGVNPTYQWQINGNPTGTSSNSFSSATLQNGDVVTCLMTSNAACPSPLTSASNGIAMTVNSVSAPAVTITSAQGTSICSGTSVFFTATPTNGGTSPNYQWKINGTNVGPNSAFFNTNALVQGDIVTCILTSNATCTNGQTATSNALIFNVTANVTPAISITANATTACQGTLVSFTSTTSNAGSSPVYQWKVNGINVGTNSATFSSTTLQNGDVVSCVLTSSLTCVTSSTATSNTISITVLPSVSAGINISSGGGSTICQGATVTFTATPTNGGTTPVYQWQINGNPTGTSSSSFSTTTLQNGDVVTCLMTSNAACPNPSTSTSNAIAMTVNAVIPPTITITSNQGTSICSGSTVVFTAAASNGGSSPSYQWKVNGIDVGSNQAFYTASNLLQGDIVTCVLTSNATCTNGQTTTSNALVFTVTSIATPGITINSSATTICQGSLVNFTALSSFGGTNPSYQWLINGNSVGGTGSTFSSASLQNGDVVSCVLTSSYGCVTSSTATSNTISIVVNPSLSTSVSIASNNGTTICAGTTTTFTATPTNGGLTPSYQWQINGSNVGTNASSFSTSSLMNGDIITCNMTSSETCAAPAQSTSNSINMTVNSVLTPTITISASEALPVCAGTAVSFIATGTNGGTTPVYQWQVNGVNAGTNNTNFSPTSIANGDVVICIITSNAACLSTTSATSNSIVFQETTIDVSVTETTTTLTANQSGASYQWINCATMTPIAGQTQQSFTPTQSGNYAVQVTVGSCVDTSTCFQLTVSGLTEDDNTSFKLYPNPAATFIYVSATSAEPFELSCLDVSGRLIQRWEISSTMSTLDLHNLAKGTYYFKMQRGQFIEVHKVFIDAH